MFKCNFKDDPIRGVKNVRHRHSRRLVEYFTARYIHRCPTYKASLVRPLDIENKLATIRMEVRNWPPFKKGTVFNFEYPLSRCFFAVEDAVKIKKLLTARVKAGVISLPILPSDVLEASASNTAEEPPSEELSDDSSCESSSTVSSTFSPSSEAGVDNEESGSDTLPFPTPSTSTGREGEQEQFPGPAELDEMFTAATEEPQLFRFRNMLWSVTRTTVMESIEPPSIKEEDATSMGQDEPIDYSRETLALVPYVPIEILPPQDEPLDLSCPQHPEEQCSVIIEELD